MTPFMRILSTAIAASGGALIGLGIEQGNWPPVVLGVIVVACEVGKGLAPWRY